MRKKVTIHLKQDGTGCFMPVEVEAFCSKCACWDEIEDSPALRVAKGVGICSRFPQALQKMAKDHCWEFIPAPEEKK